MNNKTIKNNTLISIIINYFNPSENSRIEATVSLALESIAAFTQNPFEIILADASTNISTNLMNNCSANKWHYLHLPGASFAEGYNLSFPKTSGNYLVLMASDIFVCNEWDVKMLAELHRTKACIAAPYLTASDYKPQTSNWVIKMKTFTPSAMTLNLIMMSSEHFLKIGMLDQRLGHFNDIDFLYRTRVSGGEAIITYCGQINHISGATMSISTSICYEKDKKIFLEKHPYLSSNNSKMDYNYYDKSFIRSRLLRLYLKMCSVIPSARFGNFMSMLGNKFEPLFHRI